MNLRVVGHKSGPYRRPVIDRGMILLVEDESLVREVTQTVLRGAGYRVLAARNGREARSLFHRYRRQIDLLITDIVMPDTDGRLLARFMALRSRRLKTILASGYPLSNRDEQVGASYLPKPFSAAILLNTVRETLGKFTGGDTARLRGGVLLPGRSRVRK